MRINCKAALLSGLVLPGLGQLYKGERTKGTILILTVNLFLLGMVFMVMKYIAPIIISAGMEGRYDTGQILAQLKSGGPAVKLLLSMFCVVWAYSWIDAALGNRRNE